MRPINGYQIKKIYSIASSLGIVERGSHDDELHSLVATLTDKESVKELTVEQGYQVLEALEHLQGGTSHKKSQSNIRETPGGMTAGQQRKAWALMYELKKHDTSPDSAPLGNRLCAIIKKELKQDCTAEQPFVWLTFIQGNRLIETLKKYVSNSKRKAVHGDVETSHG